LHTEGKQEKLPTLSTSSQMKLLFEMCWNRRGELDTSPASFLMNFLGQVEDTIGKYSLSTNCWKCSIAGELFVENFKGLATSLFWFLGVNYLPLNSWLATCMRCDYSAVCLFIIHRTFPRYVQLPHFMRQVAWVRKSNTFDLVFRFVLTKCWANGSNA